jgi:membrane-bound lytic murein transglycosylase A
MSQELASKWGSYSCWRAAWRAGLPVLIALAVLAGCKQNPGGMEPFKRKEKDYNAQLPPGQLALRKIDPSKYPDFSRGFYARAGLEDAIRQSLAYLAKPSSQRYFPYGDVTHERAVASLQAFLRVLQEARTPEELNQTIRRDFEVYQSVGCDEKGTVWFTGYYTPIFDGRKQPDAVFRYPLYRQPPDLQKDSEGITLGRRTPDGQIVPYPTRKEIEQGRLLDGQEIAWLKDSFEAYIVTVQGSAKLRLQDGSLYQLGYAANNGHEYNSVGKAMIARGAIKQQELSLQSLRRYFAQHPDQVYPYCWQNPRYVFFTEATRGPVGSLNVPVTPFRTIATDKKIFPRACLAFMKTLLPRDVNGQVQQLPADVFALDQDTGGAIRAAGRCDVYMGEGEAAEAVAGRTGAEGALYYIFLKSGAGAQITAGQLR